MADTNYQAQVYRARGSTSYVVASGGSVEVESGGQINEQSGAVHEFNTGAVITLNGSTFLGSTGKISAPYGLALPVETLTSSTSFSTGPGQLARAGSAIHLLTQTTAVELVRLPAPVAGDIKYFYHLGASTAIYIESSTSTGGSAVWTSTNGNRFLSEGRTASLVLVATSSTGWRIVGGVTSTGGPAAATISTTT